MTSKNQYDLEFKKMIIQKGKEIGNITAVARQHELDPKMVLGWARQLKRKDLQLLDGSSKKLPAFIPTADDYKQLEKENEKLKKLLAEKELEKEILKDLIKKNKPTLKDKIEIAIKYISMKHSIRSVLRILEIERSTYYAYIKNQNKKGNRTSNGRPIPGISYTKEGQPVSDAQICEWIMAELFGEAYAYGYRKLTKVLKKQYNLVINKKKVYRLCREMGVLRPQRIIKLKHPKRLANNRVINASNQLWEIDIKYGWIACEQRFFFFMGIIDVFDKSIISYHIGLTCEAKDLVQILQEALWKRQLFNVEEKPVIRTDNGPQFISILFEQACEKFNIIHERIPVKTPNKTPILNRFILF